VFLKSGQYWKFKARSYGGTIITKIRFRLDPSGTAKPIYSNAFDGQIAKVQFRKGPTGADLRRPLRSKDPMEGGVSAILNEVLGARDRDRSCCEAASLLKEMGPEAKDAVPALCEALANGDEVMRRDAAHALSAIRSSADLAVPALTKALGDEHWLVRSCASQA